MNKYLLMTSILGCCLAVEVTAAPTAQPIPEGCYIDAEIVGLTEDKSALDATGSSFCLSSNGELNSEVPVRLALSTGNQDSSLIGQKIFVTKRSSSEPVNGAYALAKGDLGLIGRSTDSSDVNEIEVTLPGMKEVSGGVIAISPEANSEDIIPVRFGGRGGGARFAGRGGGVRHGGRYAGARGRYYGRRAVGVGVGAAAVGAAAAGAYYGSGGGYCDPNYEDCGGGYYGPGYVGGGVYRGGVYRGGVRGGAVVRGRGAHVAHRGGGRRR